MSEESTHSQKVIPSNNENLSSKTDRNMEESEKTESNSKEEGPPSATSMTMGRVRAQMEMVQSVSRSGIGVLFEKFTEKHIDKYLDYIQRDDDHEYELRRTNRRYYLAYFVILIITLSLAVVYLLPKDKSFLESIINFLVILAGGIGAGYGLSKRKQQ